MILTTRIKVHYVCMNAICGSKINVTSYPPAPKDINQVHNYIDLPRQCGKCVSCMMVDRIDCAVLYNHFGDQVYGRWLCTKHPAKVYYPLPLEDAFNDIKEYKIQWDHLDKDYVSIAKKGYPWICPDCGMQLIYRDEREDNVNSVAI